VLQHGHQNNQLNTRVKVNGWQFVIRREARILIGKLFS